MGFGARIQHGKPGLKDDYKGEWELGTYGCAWRVIGDGKILCGSDDSVLAFRGFHAAVVADVKRFPMFRAFRADPLARGPDAKMVAVTVSARNDASFELKGRAQERG